ncbi:phospholipase D-like domain-containing protein [Pseudomonas sp. UBA7530]|uniref:phospholipase D-like domain-containing protein n=1 Tax=Pseudomonas sp. UBA7530 TaxID=1947341 RepID=UPI000EC8891A|nr:MULTISPECIES: phospholipase D-like domain-containing protein [Pseudomonas]MBH3338981.1 nuclease [Pseudomonas mendocina]HBZ93692.1 nuclease [Pseudomonas sp.]
MDFNRLDQTLRDSLADLRLSNEERDELRELGNDLSPDQVRFMRNRAFALVRELILSPEDALQALKWLEQVIKTLEVRCSPVRDHSSAHFSPGESCRQRIRDLCRQARVSVDICVYTISDDQLSEEVLACHARGVAVRVISDNEKQFDAGSDIQWLKDKGVPLRIDAGPFHMHHKFALFDGRLLLNGSFNWTRSATTSNEENLLVTDDPHLVAEYRREFDKLWARYAGN